MTLCADRAEPSPWWLLAVISAAFVIRIVFFGGLVGWDDVAYSEAARSLRHGDLVPQNMFGLRYGLIIPLAATQAWLGTSEYAAALTPLAFSMAEIILIYKLGVLYGGRSLGLLASLLLAIVPLDVMAATDLHVDLPVSVFMAATIYMVKRGESDPRWERWWFSGGGGALGLAYLTKEIALGLAAVLAIRALWLGRWRSTYGWLLGAFLVVVSVDMVWLGWVTGNLFYRHSEYITRGHVWQMMLTPPSYDWLWLYPGMLLNPLHGSFGYFAGIFYVVLAGTIWGIWRGERAVQELTIWWAPLLLLFNFTPLDPSFTRPLFLHFSRTLHPLLIPFLLVSAVWLLRGLRERLGLSIGALAGAATLAAAGIWATHFDYRMWASVSRMAVPVIEQLPGAMTIATDHVTIAQLRTLLPSRRDHIVWLGAVDLNNPKTSMVLVLDPYFLASEMSYGNIVPKKALNPPPSWEKVEEFTRPRRRHLRVFLRESVTGVKEDAGSPPSGDLYKPVVLLRVRPAE